MLHSLQAVLAPALAERLTLVINHVLSAETVATQRLQAHAGRTLSLTLNQWPALLPPPPALAWRITPAGLLEWCGAEGAPQPDLHVQIDASNPALLVARAVAGTPPAVQIDGGAQLAGDVNWLLQNLRWDVVADLERLFGAGPALTLHRIGSTLAAALRTGLKGVSQLGERFRSRSP